MPLPGIINVNTGFFSFAAQRNGPYEYGTDLYVLVPTGTSPQKANMYRSTDGGLTWAIADSTNSPTLAVAAFSGFNGVVDVDQSGTLLTMLCSLSGAGGAACIIAFDCSTNLWQAATTTAGPDVMTPPSLTNTNQVLRLASRSNGDLVALYRGGSVAGGVTTAYAIYSGGVWGAPVTVAGGAGVPRPLMGACVDSNGRVYIFYIVGPVGSTVQFQTILQRSLPIGGSLSAESTVIDDMENAQQELGLPVAWSPNGVESVGVLYARGVFFTDPVPPAPPLFLATTIGEAYLAQGSIAATPAFAGVNVNFQNTTTGQNGGGISDLVIAPLPGGDVMALWITASVHYSIAANRRTSGVWQRVNTVAWNGLIANQALYSNVYGLQGRYLASRNKVGFVYEVDIQGGGSKILYNEVGL